MSTQEIYDWREPQEAIEVVPVDPIELAVQALKKLRAAGHSGVLAEPAQEPTETSEQVIYLPDYKEAKAETVAELQIKPEAEPAEYKRRKLPVIRNPNYAMVQAARSDPAVFNRLIESYQGYLRYLSSDFFLPDGSEDDLMQEAQIGFYKAVRDYDGVSSTFNSFMQLVVRRQVITAVKTATRQKSRLLNESVSFYQTSPGSEDATIDMSDYIESPQPTVDEIVAGSESLRELLDTLGSSLSELESEALRMFLDGKSYEAMSAELGVDTKAIDNALQRTKRKILEQQARYDAGTIIRQPKVIKETESHRPANSGSRHLAPRKDTGRLNSTHLQAIHGLNQIGYPIRELADLLWQKYGYASPAACRSAISKGLQVRGLGSMTRSEAMTAHHSRRKQQKES